jgi:proto-oncogene tyrosine-protein kinase Kit
MDGNFYTGFAIVIVVSSVICIAVFIFNRKRKLESLRKTGIAHFIDGNLESFDPEQSLDKQAHLLSYNKSFEFPREKLELRKQLVKGGFGVVVEAVAQGIKPNEAESVVVVKVVKKPASNDMLTALVSELKRLIHVGQHVNLVNLLGAVTVNIAKRDFMVILEHCEFGNLKSFLVKQRSRFINEIGILGRQDLSHLIAIRASSYEILEFLARSSADEGTVEVFPISW